MPSRQLGHSLSVSSIGIGCMGMTFAYGGQEEAASIATLHRALDLGITFFDTAEIYGPFTNEELIGKAFKGMWDRVVIATKFGFKISDTGVGAERIVGLDSRPENVKKVADASLQRLNTDVIDLFYQHRVDPAVPIEDTVGAVADLIRAGKVRALGLSEAGAETIRRAHRVHPVAAVQSEYSLWTRDPEKAVLPLCKELGIGFVPYSPLGRGFLTGAIRDRAALGDNDYRLRTPRFQEGNLQTNLALVDTLLSIAKDKGVTAAQLALAWVLHQGEAVVPIPGVRTIHHLEDNAAAANIALTAVELKTVEAAIPPGTVAGERYDERGLKMINL